MSSNGSVLLRFGRQCRLAALVGVFGLSIVGESGIAGSPVWSERWSDTTEYGRLAPGFPQVDRLEFRILRDGDRVGKQIMQFRHEGDRLVVDIDTEIAVNALFVTLYRFEQEAEEIWENGRFQSYRAVTDDDGKKRDVAIQRAEDGALQVVYNGESSRLGNEAIPGNLWNLLTVEKPQILDPAKGKVRAIEITYLGVEKFGADGKERMLHHYRLKGEFERELWYDGGGLIFQASLEAKDGSIIMITRKP